MADKLFREYLFEVKSGEKGKRQIEGIASAPSVDRDGEVISIEALEKAIPGYMRNPVILASHQHRTGGGDSPVVGKCIAARVDGKGLHVTIEFAETELGEQYWTLYQDKFQRAFSIGFIPLKSEEQILDGKRVRVFTEIELLEISCVPVPANRDALSKSAQRKRDFVKKRRGLAHEWLNGPGSLNWCKRFEAWSDASDEERTKNFTEAEQAEFGEILEKAHEFSKSIFDDSLTPAEIREAKKLDEAEKRFAAQIGKSVDELDEKDFMEALAGLDLDDEIDEIGDFDDIDEILCGGKDYDFAAIVRGKARK